MTRTALAGLTGFALTFALCPPFIAASRRVRVGQHIRPEGPASHQYKAGTPTMGGIVILAATVMAALIWCHLASPPMWILLGGLVASGAIGFVDDYLKVTRRGSRGLGARAKIVGLLAVGAAATTAMYALTQTAPALHSTQLVVPFVGSTDLGLWYLPVGTLLLLTLATGVNISDGVDGLAAGMTMIVLAALTAAAIMGVSRQQWSGVGAPAPDLIVFGGVLIGACAGFLWFNWHPARLFMGDAGATMLGAGLAILAMLLKQEFLLVVAAGAIGLDAFSVVLQIASLKVRGRRLFRMAPLHHHHELGGWTEVQVVVWFWAVALVLAAAGLALMVLNDAHRAGWPS